MPNLPKTSNDHYFSANPNSAIIWTSFTVRARNIEYELKSASGVFAKKKLDTGTKLLLDKSLLPDKGKILDLGCGCGVVGITLAKISPKLEIHLVDVNTRAIKVTRENIKLQKLENVKAFQSDIYSKITDKYDVILLNPPQLAGKEICSKMITSGKDHLVLGGNLQIVLRHNKGGATMSEIMQNHYGNMQTIAKKSGYRIYFSKKE
jgi:16S rRNA (guanine1207-N2)-methyltransferase